MNNVIDINDVRGVDPILRKGDVVRITEFPWDPNFGGVITAHGCTGIVTEVLKRYGEDAEAPGQAAYVVVAIPGEEYWDEVDVPLNALRRIIGLDSKALRLGDVGITGRV
jgi:hypothetical protein